VKAVGVPFTQIAAALGKIIVKNIVALGALSEATRLFPAETFLTAVRQALSDKCALIPLNEEAFAQGMKRAAGAGKGEA
jgi:2-oxoisovalerate ferredoxin oxidoreductase beta subunit